MTTARVLCLDDDLTIARMIGDVVEFCGLVPVVEQDSIEATSTHLRDSAVRAVLVDYMMPRLDGITVLLMWQESRPDVRRVLITAAPQETEVREALRSGVAQMVISKPPSIADIKMALAWL